MANIDTNIKKGKYLKKTGADSYIHYHLDTDDSVVYLSDNLNQIHGGGEEDSSYYAKGTALHETLSALYTLASKGGQASTDLAELRQKFNELKTKHTNDINAVNTSIATTKSDLLGTASDTAGANTIHGANKAAKNAQDTADEAMNIANGQSHAYVFANVDGLRSGTLSNNQFISEYKVGDSIYIIAPDVSDFWISGGSSNGAASNANVINSAKKGDTVIVKWGSSYVSLTALESKRNLNDYITNSELNGRLSAYSTTEQIKEEYVSYSGAKYPVNLGDHTLTVSDGRIINPTETIIDKGNITLSGKTIIPGIPGIAGQSVNINVNGISVRNTMFDYPDDTTSGTLATQQYVSGKGYQTVSGVKSVIDTAIGATTGDVTFKGSVDNGIKSTLSTTGITAGTYSALTVDAKGRATKGWHWLVFAPTTNDDEILNQLAIGGVAIIDAE